MNKTRLENLSDGIFAIVMTLLVIEIRVPEALTHPSSQELLHALSELGPLFVGYGVSFAVLTMFWVSHTFFFSDTVRDINRQLIGLNMLFMAAVAFIPFSAHLIGRYPNVPFAILFYGANVLLIGVLAVARFEYALYAKEIDTAHVSKRLIAQARIRSYLTIFCTLFGMGLAFVSAPAALVLYAFPVVFNVIPGLLNALERMFGFKLGA